jgi:hypothetical protein
MQKLPDFATHMNTNLDYFPAVSELDLYLVLITSQDDSAHLKNLKDME